MVRRMPSLGAGVVLWMMSGEAVIYDIIQLAYILGGQ